MFCSFMCPLAFRSFRRCCLCGFVIEDRSKTALYHTDCYKELRKLKKKMRNRHEFMGRIQK